MAAVIDTGILSRHEDLAGVMVAGYDFVDGDTNPEDPGCPDATTPSHGTHLSGTIAALTSNGRGVAGVNWGGAASTRIMPLRVFTNDAGSCAATTDRVVDAVYYAVSHSARVVNMSFGIGYGNFSQALQDAINYAVAAGVVVVASAGNDNRDLDQLPRYPVCFANVIGVAATTITNARPSYSNFGSCVDVVAPGGDLSTDLNNDGNPDGVLSTSGTQAAPSQYLFTHGTSFAASHVTGLAALLMAKGVTGPSTVQSVLQSSATDLGPSGYDPSFGWGLISAGAALGAPASTNLMRAFTGISSSSSITVASDMVAVSSSGTFSVDILPGEDASHTGRGIRNLWLGDLPPPGLGLAAP
ncbi:MAG: S8 family serine peptidase [Armatimonadota bacterium]|nr:S8 family serine peptidase [Armatimonadota bacterium]MDR7464828.1 S8 family serine peptidase [Armatimonadota bacterium]MDR7540337.1 S8 family serine peptidase [Armatimonadota bacterium]